MKSKLVSVAVALSMAPIAQVMFVACQSETAPEPDGTTMEDASPLEARDRCPDEGRFCGGIAGIPCPEGLVCVDDPTDDCDPEQGGRDCGGVCVSGERACDVPGRRYVSRVPDRCASIRFRCHAGRVPFFDECGCGCEPAKVLIPCGENECGPGEYCCNESCSICAPLGGSCIQIVCE